MELPFPRRIIATGKTVRRSVDHATERHGMRQQWRIPELESTLQGPGRQQLAEPAVAGDSLLLQEYCRPNSAWNRVRLGYHFLLPAEGQNRVQQRCGSSNDDQPLRLLSHQDRNCTEQGEFGCQTALHRGIPTAGTKQNVVAGCAFDKCNAIKRGRPVLKRSIMTTRGRVNMLTGIVERIRFLTSSCWFKEKASQTSKSYWSLLYWSCQLATIQIF